MVRTHLIPRLITKEALLLCMMELSEMSADTLREKREMYHEQIHLEQCYSSNDVMTLQRIEQELAQRGDA